MNANQNRKYMEAIREMVNHKADFRVRDVLKSHGVPTTCDDVLRRLKWTKGLGGNRGSAWIHTKPVNEAELLQMAITMRLKLEELNRVNYEKYFLGRKAVTKNPAARAQSPKQKRLVIIQEAPVKTVKPVVKRAPARKEVSILWGMIKWTR